jgi:hypothetical protein
MDDIVPEAILRPFSGNQNPKWLKTAFNDVLATKTNHEDPVENTFKAPAEPEVRLQLLKVANMSVMDAINHNGILGISGNVSENDRFVKTKKEAENHQNLRHSRRESECSGGFFQGWDPLAQPGKACPQQSEIRKEQDNAQESPITPIMRLITPLTLPEQALHSQKHSKPWGEQQLWPKP